MAGTKSKWTRRRKITLDELVNEPWRATPLDTSIGSLLMEPFRTKGLEVPRLAVASVLSPQLSFACWRVADWWPSRLTSYRTTFLQSNFR